MPEEIFIKGPDEITADKDVTYTCENTGQLSPSNLTFGIHSSFMNNPVVSGLIEIQEQEVHQDDTEKWITSQSLILKNEVSRHAHQLAGQITLECHLVDPEQKEIVTTSSIVSIKSKV